MNIGTAFAQKYAVMCIHMWLLLVRLRAEGDDGKDLAQMLYEHFQEDVEAMVRAQGVTVRPLDSSLGACPSLDRMIIPGSTGKSHTPDQPLW